MKVQWQVTPGEDVGSDASLLASFYVFDLVITTIGNCLDRLRSLAKCISTDFHSRSQATNGPMQKRMHIQTSEQDLPIYPANADPIKMLAKHKTPLTEIWHL
jgi:hypothetical protein